MRRGGICICSLRLVMLFERLRTRGRVNKTGHFRRSYEKMKRKKGKLGEMQPFDAAVRRRISNRRSRYIRNCSGASKEGIFAQMFTHSPISEVNDEEARQRNLGPITQRLRVTLAKVPKLQDPGNAP